MTDQNVNTPGSTETNTITVDLPEELMAKVVLFCESKNVSIEQFTIEALSEKIGKWKEQTAFLRTGSRGNKTEGEKTDERKSAASL